MPTFKVNGVTASTTEGAVTVAATNSFTLSWSGLDSATNYPVRFQIEATNGSYMDLTNSAGTDMFLYYYATPEYASDWMTYKAIGTSGSDTITSASNLAGYKLTINYVTTFESATYYVTFVSPSPTITKQPTISSINPSSGASTTITWSAATVSNQGNSTIYYQYFVGPNSTYSDSYHIGTTTGTSATITEAQIISKCGNGFGASSSGSTCYLFVRAYWDNGSAQGGWATPTNYKSFTYYPTIKAPTNFSITPTTGQSTVLKWNNTKAGNNSDCQIILYIDNNQVASGIQGSNSGYTIGEDVWKTLGEGNHAIKIAHEYYGRYAYTSSLTFTYKKPYQTISYYTNGNFVPCKVFYYTNNEWKLCNINYYTGGSWKPCSTT